MFVKLVVLLASIVCLGQSYIIDLGARVKATRGAVWPKPQTSTTYKQFYSFSPQKFQFKVAENSCRLLDDALQRYWKLINSSITLQSRGRFQELGGFPNETRGDNFLATLTTLDIVLNGPCSDNDYPNATMDESYTLNVSNSTRTKSSLVANSTWGMLRGLETFSQLIYLADDNIGFIINGTYIKDFPRFSHRGLLLDTSRHFLPVDTILQNLEAMSYNKLNVFHWHIVDDHSFPYQSIRFPELSEKGAYHPIFKVYRQIDIRKIIEYARVRGIRVLPEFDTPGHTRSWGEGVKNILTPCYKNGKPTGKYGPFDPSKESVYSFLGEFFKEVINVFPEKYIHLGGNEVSFECWRSNPDISKFMIKHKIALDYIALERYYIKKLLHIVTNQSAKALIWQEVFTNGIELPKNTIIHVWDGGHKILAKATKAGRPAILSSCWHLDYIPTLTSWDTFYNCDPHDFHGTYKQKKLVMGGEACMWGESVNEYNVEPRIWPRTSAIAEKLWSRYRADTVHQAAGRLEEHTCRMNLRGIPAQPPNGPGVCL